MVEKIATYNKNIRCQFVDLRTHSRCSMLSVQGNSLCAMHIHQRRYGDCFNGELSDIYSRVASSPQILDLSNELNVQRTLLVTVCNSFIAALVEMDLPEDKIKMLAEKFNKLSIPLYPR